MLDLWTFYALKPLRVGTARQRTGIRKPGLFDKAISAVRRGHGPLLAVLLAFCLLGLTYVFRAPPFSGPDEHLHYHYAAFVSLTGRLPVHDPAQGPKIVHGLYEGQAQQTPLYYLALARMVPLSHLKGGGEGQMGVNGPPDASVAPMLAELWGEVAYPNPHYLSTDRGNRQVFVAACERPWQPVGCRLLYVGRLLSLGLGVVTLLATYAAGRTFLPTNVALLGVAFFAFNPQFLFISATVSNDSAVTALSSVALWRMLRWLRVGAGAGEALFIGGLIGLAALAKLSGLYLVVFWHGGCCSCEGSSPALPGPSLRRPVRC